MASTASDMNVHSCWLAFVSFSNTREIVCLVDGDIKVWDGAVGRSCLTLCAFQCWRAVATVAGSTSAEGVPF